MAAYMAALFGHFLELGFSSLKRPDKKLLLWRSPTQ
jgi:hypothetical protein